MRDVARAALFALALVAAASAAAQEPALSTELEQSLGRLTRAPAVPQTLRDVVREASRERLIVRRIRGDDIVIDIDDREAEGLSAFLNGRFVGFSYAGYEFFGYTLIDRAAAGEAALLDTGDRPVFSSDGRYFASAVITENGYGDPEGVTVWEVLPDRTARRFYTDALPRGIDWRVDGWPRDDCVAISAIEYGWEPPAGLGLEEAMSRAPRMQFEIVLDDAGAALTRSVASTVCGVSPSE
ncbi:MAG TPA: hypothetical protein VF704_01655 [Allosphingosinicella sp.]